MDRKELITKLTELNSLIEQRASLIDLRDKGATYRLKATEKMVEHGCTFPITAPSFLECFYSVSLSEFPNSSDVRKKIEKSKEEQKGILSAKRYYVYSALLTAVIFFFEAFFIFIGLEDVGQAFNVPFIISLLAMLFLRSVYNGKKNSAMSAVSVNDSIMKHNEKVKKFNDEYEKRSKRISEIDEEKKKAFKEFEESAVNFGLAYSEVKQMLDEAEKQIPILNDEIAKYDDIIISSVNYPRIPRIITLLNDGAAKDVGEAVRIVTEVERREQVEAEQEARAFAAQQEHLRMQERQIQETERHNREIERQNRESQAVASAQAKDSAAQANAAEQQAISAGRRQCTWCARYNECYVSVRKANRGNCASYRPKKI